MTSAVSERAGMVPGRTLQGLCLSFSVSFSGLSGLIRPDGSRITPVLFRFVELSQPTVVCRLPNRHRCRRFQGRSIPALYAVHASLQNNVPKKSSATLRAPLVAHRHTCRLRAVRIQGARATQEQQTPCIAVVGMQSRSPYLRTGQEACLGRFDTTRSEMNVISRPCQRCPLSFQFGGTSIAKS